MSAPAYATRPVDAVVYDIEIARCIQGRGEPRDPTLLYCDGWTDYLGMGIAVLAAFDTRTRAARVFLEDNLDDFRRLIDGRVVAGYNNQKFDDPLCEAHGITIPHSYDLRVEVLKAAGAGPRTPGYKLDELVRANFGVRKPMDGGLAPKQWQRGQRGSVIDYCLFDVMQTARLLQRRTIVDPVTGLDLELAPVPAVSAAPALAGVGG